MRGISLSTAGAGSAQGANGGGPHCQCQARGLSCSSPLGIGLLLRGLRRHVRDAGDGPHQVAHDEQEGLGRGGRRRAAAAVAVLHGRGVLACDRGTVGVRTNNRSGTAEAQPAISAVL